VGSPKRRKREAVEQAPAMTIADYYRMKLTGVLPPTQPTYEEYLRAAAGA
jgi:hypothetical protein